MYKTIKKSYKGYGGRTEYQTAIETPDGSHITNLKQAVEELNKLSQVWVAQENYDGGSNYVLGVFDSEEKAKAFIEDYHRQKGMKFYNRDTNTSMVRRARWVSGNKYIVDSVGWMRYSYQKMEVQ